jgi:beta-lactam-binding protein with PASTA domain
VIRGLSEADGIALLIDAGLTPGRRIERFNDTIAADLLVRTDPAADEVVPAGTVVDYVISKGPEAAAAPAFVGLAIDDAQALAAGAGLTLDVTEQADDSVPVGTVLFQDPPAGEPLTGPRVAVTVARTAGFVTVPTVRGLSEADAISLLVDAGLTPGRRLERFNATVEAGLVLRTDPPAETPVEAGTTVDYVISRGPEPLPVPDVSGLPLGDADGVARDNGLTLDVTYSNTLEAPPDTVLSQDPRAGEPGDGTRTIRVVVSRAPSTVLIPRLRGVPEGDAIATLVDAGLKPGERSERSNPTIPAGSLLSTDPRGDNEVPPGTVVDYMVSTGPRPDTPDPTPSPTRAPRDTPEPTPGGGGGDPVAGMEGVIGQAAAIRELEQLAGVPVEVVLQRELRQALRSASGGGSAAETATLERLGLIPPGTDLARARLDLLASGTVAWYDPGAKVLKVRDNALDAVLRFFAAGEAGRALIDQHVGLGFVAPDDPTQTDRAAARAALLGGDQALLMIDWAGQHLSPDEQAQLPGLVSTDPSVLQSVPLYLRRLFTFPTEEGRAFVQALRDAGGWAAVTDAYERLPASTEQILHPEKYRGDRPVAIELPDPSGALGAGWSVTDVRTMGELGIGIWLDDGADGAPNAWAADGWGGDRVVTLDGPDGAWAVVWQTAWDSETDADEFAGMADQAMADLPGAHVVLRGADLVGGLSSTALVIVASDGSVIDAILAGSGLGS